jgi:hypothetical protein
VLLLRLTQGLKLLRLLLGLGLWLLGMWLWLLLGLIADGIRSFHDDEHIPFLFGHLN